MVFSLVHIDLMQSVAPLKKAPTWIPSEFTKMNHIFSPLDFFHIRFVFVCELLVIQRITLVRIEVIIMITGCESICLAIMRKVCELCELEKFWTR